VCTASKEEIGTTRVKVGGGVNRVCARKREKIKGGPTSSSNGKKKAESAAATFVEREDHTEQLPRLEEIEKNGDPKKKCHTKLLGCRVNSRGETKASCIEDGTKRDRQEGESTMVGGTGRGKKNKKRSEKSRKN